MTVSNTDDLDQIIADNDSTTDLDAGLGGGSSSNPFALPGSNPSGQMLPGYVPATVQKLRNEADIAQVTPDEISGRNADRFGGAAGKVFAGLMQQAATSASAKNKPDFSYATQGIDDAQKAEDADLAERQGYAKQLLAQADSQQKRADTVSMGMAKLASLKDIAQGKRETTGRLIDVKKQLADNQTAALDQGKYKSETKMDDSGNLYTIITNSADPKDVTVRNISGPSASRQGTTDPKLASQDTRRLDVLGGKLASETQSGRQGYGQSAQKIQAIEAAKVLLDQADARKAANGGHLDVREYRDLATSLAKVLSPTNISEKQIHALMPDTLSMNIAQLKEKAGMGPQDAGLSQFAERIGQTLKREKEVALMQVGKTQGELLMSYRDLAQRNPEAVIPLLEKHHIDVAQAYKDWKLPPPNGNNGGPQPGVPAAASTTSPVGGGQQQAQPQTLNRDQANAAKPGTVFIYNGHKVRKLADGTVEQLP